MPISERSFIINSLICLIIVESLLLFSYQTASLSIILLSGYVVYELAGLVIIHYHNERIKNGEDQEDKK